MRITDDIDEANRMIHVLRRDLKEASVRYFVATFVIAALGLIIFLQQVF